MTAEDDLNKTNIAVIRALQKAIPDNSLKRLVSSYLNGRLENPDARSALNLILGRTEPETAAVRHLARVTENPALKTLLNLYARGDVAEESLQAAIRDARKPASPEPEIAVVRQLARVTENPALKTLLNLYARGDVAQESLQAAIRDTRKKASPKQVDTPFIVLNSFPKSGNTWLRSFLSHLCFDGELECIPDCYSESLFDAPTYVLPDGTAIRFYKSHERELNCEIHGVKIAHAALIHIRRHPLDVFLSYLNHLHRDRQYEGSLRKAGAGFATDFHNVEEIIASNLVWPFLGVFMVYGTLNPQFRSAGSWYENMEFWMNELPVDCPVFRYSYESLLQNQAGDLMELGSFLGKSTSEVERAFQAAQESTAKDGGFFWQQIAGLHGDILDPAQLAAYRDMFGEKMRAYGYT